MRNLLQLNGFRLAIACLMMGAAFGFLHYTRTSTSWNLQQKIRGVESPSASSSDAVIGKDVNFEDNGEKNDSQGSDENSKEIFPQYSVENPKEKVEENVQKSIEENEMRENSEENVQKNPQVANTEENVPKNVSTNKEKTVPVQVVDGSKKNVDPLKAEENVPKNAEKSFYTIAKESGTDKVTDHQYECLYEDTLLPYRHLSGLKILEIGLGCNMAYGPGASMTVWASYFRDAQIYFLEFDEKCGENWLARIIHPKKPIMTYGDQANVTLLRKMVVDHGPWDIIVDDGGHMMNQQITSFTELFPAIKPGGTYYIEDLATSLLPSYGGTDNGINTLAARTAIGFISEVFAESIRLRVRDGRPGSSLERITCCDEICGIRTKKISNL